jgi:hypothetical protein
VLLCAAIFTSWWSTAFESYLWPVLGFLFMPFTTLAYMAAMVYNDHTLSGGYLVMLIIGVVLDLSGHGATANAKSSS